MARKSKKTASLPTSEQETVLFTVDVSDKEQVRRVEQALAKVLAGPPMSPEEFNALVNEALLKPKVVKKPAKRKRKPGSSQSIRAMRG